MSRHIAIVIAIAIFVIHGISVLTSLKILGIDIENIGQIGNFSILMILAIISYECYLELTKLKKDD